MEPVFCKSCQFCILNSGYNCCMMKPIFKNTYYEKETYWQYCDDINKNNDCKMYRKKAFFERYAWLLLLIIPLILTIKLLMR
jgi:hypothetical protein